MSSTTQQLNRQTFTTSRLMDFFSEKELITQIGHDIHEWPLVCVKELVDNALDACEEAGVSPIVSINVDDVGITVIDNGPGIPADTVTNMLDYSIRVSSREAYCSPDRGAQGNALKTLIAMPFVLNGQQGHVEVHSHGITHDIICKVDRIQQVPVIDHEKSDSIVKAGTRVVIHWPLSANLGTGCCEGSLFTNRGVFYLFESTSQLDC